MLIPKFEKSAHLSNQLRNLSRQDPFKAAQELEKFLKEHPEDTEAHLRLNLALIRQAELLIKFSKASNDNPIKAEDILRKVLKKEPANWLALSYFTILLRDQNREKEIIELWQGPLMDNLKDIDYRIGYAWALTYNKRKEEALVSLHEAKRILKENPGLEYESDLARIVDTEDAIGKWPPPKPPAILVIIPE